MFSDYNGAKSSPPLGTKSPLCTLWAALHCQWKCQGKRFQTHNCKLEVLYKSQVIAQNTHSMVCCCSETQNFFPFNFQSLPVSLFSAARVKVMYENPIPNLSVISTYNYSTVGNPIKLYFNWIHGQWLCKNIMQRLQKTTSCQQLDTVVLRKL